MPSSSKTTAKPTRARGTREKAPKKPLAATLWSPPRSTIGFDTSAALSATQATELAEAGYRFAIRYVGLSGSTPSWALSKAEIASLQAAGLAIGVVQTFRETGITAAQGTADGAWAASQVAGLGIPSGIVIWCDMEGTYSGITADVLTQYLDNWGKAVQSGGYQVGLYCAGQPLLSWSQIFALPPFTHYWQAGDYAVEMPAVPGRGFQMYQMAPWNLAAAGTLIDVDVVEQDLEGGTPVFWPAP
jgi:hypothetical protein